MNRGHLFLIAEEELFEEIGSRPCGLDGRQQIGLDITFHHTSLIKSNYLVTVRLDGYCVLHTL